MAAKKIPRALALVFLCGVALFLFYAFASEIPLGAGLGAIRLEAAGAGLQYRYDAFAGFHGSDGGFFFYTKDGVKYLTANGDVRLDVPYSMTRPVASGRGAYLAVGEQHGSVLYLFNPEGLLHRQQFEHPIINFFVSAGGFCTVLLDGPDAYRSQIFDPKGQVVFVYEHRDKNIFPVAAGVSKDGKLCVFGFLDVGGMAVTSSLIFGNIESQTVFASLRLDQQMLLTLEFTETRLLVVTDAGLRSISVSPQDGTRLEAQADLRNRLAQLQWMGNGVALALGEGLPGQAQDPPGALLLYDAYATPTGRYEAGLPATFLRVWQDRALLGTNHVYRLLNGSGAVLWQYNAERDLKDFLVLDNNTVLLATDTEAQLYKIRTVRE
jgi:hypothetical protein